MTDFQLNPDLYNNDVKQEPTRAGFGRVKAAGEANESIVALCADLTEARRCTYFAKHSQKIHRDRRG